jgi:SPP1 gp7 family putative phage head morphogenesis protein
MSLDNTSSRRIIEHYQDSYRQIELSLKTLTDAIEAKKASGEKPNVSWLKKEERYKDLITQIRVQMNRFSVEVTKTITNGQEKSISIAQQQSRSLVEEQMKEGTENQGSSDVFARVGQAWNYLPSAAFENMVGFFSNGSPLKAYFDQQGRAASLSAERVLTHAIIAGYNPRQTAKKLKDSLGGILSKALTVARTEQLRAYRQASSDSYRANDDIVEGWIRIETLDDLTCVICIAEHGKEYENKDDFETHPNCRGTMIPRVKGVQHNIEKGTEWFDRQSDEKKLEILGQARYDMYKQGMSLSDMVVRTENADWGGGRKLLSVVELSDKLAESEKSVDITETVRVHTEDVIDDKTRHALNGYVSGSYTIGNILRNGPEWEARNLMTDYTSGEYSRVKNTINDQIKMIDRIDKAMEKSATENTGIVYRGLRSDEIADSLKPGAVFVDKAFLSTSTNREIAVRFAEEEERSGQKILMEITVPKGSKALDLEKASSTGADFKQGEILLDRGGSYKIIDTEDKDGRLYVKAILVKQEKEELQRLTASFSQVMNYRKK